MQWLVLLDFLKLRPVRFGPLSTVRCIAGQAAGRFPEREPDNGILYRSDQTRKAKQQEGLPQRSLRTPSNHPFHSSSRKPKFESMNNKSWAGWTFAIRCGTEKVLAGDGVDAATSETAGREFLRLNEFHTNLGLPRGSWHKATRNRSALECQSHQCWW